MEAHIHRDLCFVLKVTPFRERDVIATLFSEQKGKFSAIARNAVQSRRFGGSLNLFTASDFEINTQSIRMSETSEDRLVSILSATVRHSISELKAFERLSAASCLNELLMKGIPQHKPAPELFKLYSNCLFALEERAPELSIAIVNAFILKLTQWLGVQPSLTRCIACEKALSEIQGETVYPQVMKGAWICQECFPEKIGAGLSKTTILDAYHSMLQPIRKIEFQATHPDHEGLLQFLEKHLLYFVPGLDQAPLSSTRFLYSGLTE